MRILHLTAGTGRWHCGSCIRDDTLVKALRALGHEADLVPLYLPIVADGISCSAGEPVLIGGVNAYLQQEVPLFRRLPQWVDGVLSSGPFLALAGSFAGSTRPESLGAMTVSMLEGPRGNQAKEIDRLIGALRRRPKPDVIVLSNSLLVGLIAPLREALGVRVAVTVQGEPHFLDALDEGREAGWRLVAEGLRSADARIAVSAFAADLVAARTGLARSSFAVVHNGIDLEGYSPAAQPPPNVLGYLGRLYAPKGLDRIVEIYLRLRARGHDTLRLALAGTLNPGDRPGLDAALDRLGAAGVRDEVDVHPNLSLEAKQAFLRGITVFCVPTAKDDTFGTYNLEALASGLPVVAPRRGAIPEVVGPAGGVLVGAEDVDGFVGEIEGLMADPGRRARMGELGRAWVVEKGTAAGMARGVVGVVG